MKKTIIVLLHFSLASIVKENSIFSTDSIGLYQIDSLLKGLSGLTIRLSNGLISG